MQSAVHRGTPVLWQGPITSVHFGPDVRPSGQSAVSPCSWQRPARKQAGRLARVTLRAACRPPLRFSCAIGAPRGAWKTASKIERTPSNSRKQPRVDAKARHLRSTGTAGVSPAAFPNTRRRSFVSSQSPTTCVDRKPQAARFSCVTGARIAHGKLLRKQ